MYQTLKECETQKKHLNPKQRFAVECVYWFLSSFITQFALVIVIAAVNNTLKVSQIMTSIVLGLASGILPVISYNYGSGKLDRVKKLYKFAVGLGSIGMIVAWLILEIFLDQIVRIFGEQSWDPALK